LKKILFISASPRIKGNGDVLLSLCEKNVSDPEFLTEKLYIKDLNIKNCTGCMKCVLKNQFCRIDDDLKVLVDKIQTCDYLFISSPVYFLGAASIIQIINERLLYLHNIIDYKKIKKAGIIITAGRENWEGFAVQNLSILLLTLGFKIQDVFLAHGQGPAEVLLDADIENKINMFKDNVFDKNHKVATLSDKCPVCFGDSFNLTDKTTVKCPVCNITGKISETKDNKTLILFSESDINNSRWSKENLKDHMENWVTGSGQNYKDRVREIIKRRKELLSN
jgi:multimeric flavodoxin WrbA/uncharacterized Zn finger protein (UPF0148 family)